MINAELRRRDRFAATRDLNGDFPPEMAGPPALSLLPGVFAPASLPVFHLIGSHHMSADNHSRTAREQMPTPAPTISTGPADQWPTHPTLSAECVRQWIADALFRVAIADDQARDLAVRDDQMARALGFSPSPTAPAMPLAIASAFQRGRYGSLVERCISVLVKRALLTMHAPKGGPHVEDSWVNVGIDFSADGQVHLWIGTEAPLCDEEICELAVRAGIPRDFPIRARHVPVDPKAECQERDVIWPKSPLPIVNQGIPLRR